MRYSHSGGAVPTTITVGMSDVSVADILLDSAQGWPDGSEGPFFAVIDRGLSTEEKVLLGNRSGVQVSVLQRAADDTVSYPHSAGAPIEHVFSAVEADEANAHVNQTDGAHGVPPGETIATQEWTTQQVDAAHPQTYSDEEQTVAGSAGPSLQTATHGLPYPDADDDLQVRAALRLLAEAADGAIRLILSGSGDPPDPTGLPDGTIYLRRQSDPPT